MSEIETKYEERMHSDVKEHKHAGYDYWHPTARAHAGLTKDELPAGHVLSKKPLAEKLILDLVEVTPIQMMSIGASLEIGAVQSLMEGLLHHRKVASAVISSDEYGNTTFYAEWEPNHSTKVHRYLIYIWGEDVYVGYFPYDGRKPKLYGIHHNKQEVVKFLHRTHSANLQLPELPLLTELNIPNISFGLVDPSPMGAHTTISHRQGSFYTHSIYGAFVLQQRPVDSTGYNMGDPQHPWYMFQGATGYIQLYEGKMFCYPDGSIRFLTKEQEETIFRGYTNLQIVQGDLVAYELERHTVPEPLPQGIREHSIDRHNIKVDGKPCLLKYDNLDGVFVGEDCTLTITHPEHGECKYEARKGEMLALLPGTSRPFQKETEGRD